MNAKSEFISFARTARTGEEVFTRLSMSGRLAKHNKIWTQLVYHEGDFGSLFLLLQKSSIGAKKLQDNCATLELSKAIGGRNPQMLDGIVLISARPESSLYVITTISESAYWKEVVSPFISKKYPKLVRNFFRQAELRKVLVDFERSFGDKFELRVTDLTMKERRTLNGRKQEQRSSFDSERKWTSTSITSAFDEASERGQWFKSIKMGIYRQKNSENSIATLRLTKDGLISQDHMFSATNERLLTSLAEIARNNIKLFEKRGLIERDYSPGRPLAITFPLDLFKEKSNVRRFAKLIDSYPNSSNAIFHGNPYFHASLADYLDGSSFELWVLSSRRVLIVPQARTSPTSLERLVGYIFDKFAEGEIGEYATE